MIYIPLWIGTGLKDSHAETGPGKVSIFNMKPNSSNFYINKPINIKSISK